MNRAWTQLRAESRAFLTPWEPSWPADDLTRTAFRRRIRRYHAEIREDRAYPFFIFRQSIFDHLGPNEELVEGPFSRLMAAGQLMAYEYDGFWKAMDTFKDKQQFDELLAQGSPPWEVWRR